MQGLGFRVQGLGFRVSVSLNYNLFALGLNGGRVLLWLVVSVFHDP